MAQQTWNLIDAAKNVQMAEWSHSVVESAGPVSLRTLRGGLREGVQLLEIDNGAMRVAIVPQRGMGIWKAWCDDTEIGWQSPVPGPVHPKFVPLTEPSGLGWLDGFDELLVRCGLHSNGAPEFDQQGRLAYPLHGRIANLPAHKLSVEFDEENGDVSVTGVVDECRFHFQKLRLTSTLTMRPGESRFHVHDEVENLSGSPGEMQMLYHINFGPPVHGPGAELVVPVAELAPRDDHAASNVETWNQYGPEQPGAAEQVYFFKLQADRGGRSSALLKDSAGTRGVSIGFDTRQLPCFVQWKNTPAAADGYVTGLEPGTNFPNCRSYEAEQGRVVQLPPGGKAEFDLTIAYHDSADSVAEAEAQIRRLQSAGPIIHRQPQPGWSV